MKWYPHDPAAALEGMIGLTAEERGYYFTLIDLIYARAPNGHVTDELVVQAMAARPQVWKRVKASLIAKGKVRDNEGLLTANGTDKRIAVFNRKSTDGKSVGALKTNEKSSETPAKLLPNPPCSGVVSEVKSAKINDLAGVESRSKTLYSDTSYLNIDPRDTPSGKNGTRAGKGSKASSIPPDCPDAKDREYTQDKGWSEERISAEAERFRDYAQAHGRLYKDWHAAWRNWVNSPYCKEPTPLADGLLEENLRAQKKLNEYIQGRRSDFSTSSSAGETIARVISLYKNPRSGNVHD